jgi:hypothetical protein
MTRYQKQIYSEMERMIAKTPCKICQEPIGKTDYVAFEERYFHSHCLKQSSPGVGHTAISQRKA